VISVGLVCVGFAAPRAVLLRVLVGLFLALLCNGIPVGFLGWQLLRSVNWQALLPRPRPAPDVPIAEEQWRDFTGPNNRFQVEMPGTPIDREERVPGLRDPIRMHVVDLGNRAFFVSVIDISREEMFDQFAKDKEDKLRIPLEQRFKGARDGMLKNTPKAHLTSEKEIVHDGAPGREIVLQIPNEGQMVARLLAVDNRMYTLLAGGRDFAPNHADVRRFFESFRHMPPAIIAPTQLKGLVCYWGFNEKDGTHALEGSGNGRDAEIVAAERVPGMLGNALKFDGKGYLKVKPGIPLANDEGRVGWTLAGWFKASATQKSTILWLSAKHPGPLRDWDKDWRDIVFAVGLDGADLKAGFGSRRLLTQAFDRDAPKPPEPKPSDKKDKGERPSVEIEKAAPYDASNIAVFSRANDDRWHHFAITTVGGNALFIDGKLRANFKAELLFKAEEIHIGANFVGLLDEICIFHPGLQAPEIQALAGKNPDYVDPPPPRVRK
jgi:hypothetical protein